MNKNLDVLVLFSGCAGFSEGFKQAGFNIIYANDIWNKAIDSHKLNHSNAEHVLGNIQELDTFPNANIVIGSPPCQKFSHANKNRNPELGLQMVKEFERVVKIVNPDYWVWENVSAVAKYYKNSSILDAYDFGLPQHRKRCFVANFSFIRNNTKKGIQTPEYLYDGGTVQNLEKSKSGFKHKVCSGTVCTKRIRDVSTNQYLDMQKVKELMGFPLDYKLVDGVSIQQKLLGNAVCPPVAKVIAEALSELI